MKLGIECEGRLKGIPTLFCDAAHIEEAKAWLVENKRVSHVYISDKDNTLDYLTVSTLFPFAYVTLDVTCVKKEPRPQNVSLMLRVDPSQFVWKGPDEATDVPNWTFLDIERLTEHDQIKFELNRTVIVLPMTAAIRTKPEDFAGDITL